MRRTVLVTGGSGVVGSAVLRVLGGHDVVALVRRQVPVGARRTVRGDIRQARLGLDPATYDELCATVSVVVHAAADTGMGRRADHARTNIDGTREVVGFAAAAGASLIHLSTAYVHDGISDVDAASGYESSKRAAEELVRAAGLPTAVLRPSIVVGDSQTGEISAQQGLHQVVTGMIVGTVPCLPGHPTATVDFVPQDYLAEVIRALVDRPARDWPAEVWITQGPAAMPLGEIAAMANRFAERLRLPHRVRCVPYDTIERLFLPVFLAELPPPRQEEIRRLLRLARYMNVDRPFPCSVEAFRRLGLGAMPAPSPLLERNLEWWCRSSRYAERVGS